MILTSKDIARMIDLSCVRTTSNQTDIDKMVRAAQIYGFGQVSVLQSFIPYTKSLIENMPEIRLVGNVSFPSGSDSTPIKVLQAQEMAAAGCDEIDMVLNVGKLRSGAIEEVTADVNAVVKAAAPIPVKVIIEIMALTENEARQACQITLQSGAAFVKTGTGWMARGTTVEDIRLIHSIVGDRIKIKASGGIRSLETLLQMLREGATRFGINLQSGTQIIEQVRENGDRVKLD